MKEFQDLTLYLNNLQTLEAEFYQQDIDGNKSKGQIMISKPDLMRLEYHHPRHVLFIVNGKNIIHYDYALEEKSFISKDLDIFRIFNHKITDELCISDEDYIEITLKTHDLKKIKDKLYESDNNFVLVMKKYPLHLYKILIDHDEKLVSSITLSNIKINDKISEKHFLFSDQNVSLLNED